MASRARRHRVVDIGCFRTVVTCWLILIVCQSVNSQLWGSSTSSFSLARELAHGTSSVIVVPGNHSVAGDFQEYEKGTPLQLTR
jgi:hypothetical protein